MIFFQNIIHDISVYKLFNYSPGKASKQDEVCIFVFHLRYEQSASKRVIDRIIFYKFHVNLHLEKTT